MHKTKTWINRNLKERYYFSDCLGISNETHILAHISYVHQIIYQNQESFFS